MTRILLAEDSQTQAFQIKAKLVDEGYDVQWACDGKAALELIPQFWPHLILTDMNMPEMDGLELVRHSVDRFPVIPIILITAQGSDQLALDALEAGAAAYLPKSLMDEKLFSTIDEVLDVMDSSASYSKLLESMDYNEMHFTLENRISLIRPLVHLVKQMSVSVSMCDDTEAIQIGMALDHVLRNAMLHGNLELTTEEIESDSELAVQGEPNLVERRAEEPRYCNRRVHVTTRLTPEGVSITVRDDGHGFDWRAYLTNQTGGVLDPQHGRGLVLIGSMMDGVRFNSIGNEITFNKRSRMPEEVNY
jgi:CheY-like chemotaxis protein